MKATSRWLLTSTCVFALMGCASEALVQSLASDGGPKQAQYKGQYKVVAVDVASEAKAEEITDQISAAIVSKLRSSRAFDRVLSKSVTLEKRFDLVISVTPKDYINRDTSQAWLGIFGGRSSLKVQVVLLDGNTGRTLVSGVIEGKARTKTTIFTSSSMALAIDLVGEEVAKFALHHIQ